MTGGNLEWVLDLGADARLKLAVRVTRFLLRPDPQKEIAAEQLDFAHEPIPVKVNEVLQQLRFWIGQTKKWVVKLGGFGEATLIIRSFEYDAVHGAITKLNVDVESINWTR